MPLKIRNLGSVGVITDVDPYDLPTEAWSMGVNVRFQNKRVQRAPVFRNVVTLAFTDPRFCTSSLPTTGLDLLVNCFLNGRVANYTTSGQNDMTPAGYVNNTSELPYTSCHLADVFYINRGDHPPWYKHASDTSFQVLPIWDVTWGARLLRSCGNALVALNVTKGGSSYPTMVKTSSLPTAGTTPSSWDQTLPATLATENILAELEGSIIDAHNLGNSLFIYGLNDTWVMSPTNDTAVFDYRPTPFGKGSINANCAITVGGRQYVFGVNDIWMHDGVSHVSICDQKVRQFIYSTINIKQALRCFVQHSPSRNEIHFCYVSGDNYIGFSGGLGCNRAAIYNYVDGTWAFDDLPFVFSACLANVDQTQTYASVTSTYTTMGGTYLDQEDSLKHILVFVGELNATYSLGTSLYAFDPYGLGSQISFPVDTHATLGSYLERTGIDLDEVAEADLAGYKVIRTIYPQARLGVTAANLKFSFGAADAFSESPVYSPYQDYNGMDLYQVDFMSAGRYLAMRVLFPDYQEMTLSGFDLDVEITGER